MKQLAPFALFLFSFQIVLPMEGAKDNTQQAVAQLTQAAQPAAQQSNVLYTQDDDQHSLPPPQSDTTVPTYQSLGSLIAAPLGAAYRGIQYYLGLNNIDWKMLHDEHTEGIIIVSTYFNSIDNGTIVDPTILAKFKRRKDIANNIADRLTRKLAVFYTKYEKAENKVTFFTDNNDEWKQIIEIDLDQAQFLISEYPKRLLPPEVVNRLDSRIGQIKTLISSINKK